MNRCTRLPSPLLALVLVATSLSGFSQLQFTTGNPAQWYVQNVLAGPGVQISNVTYTGDLDQLAEFWDGNTTNIGMDRGFIMSVGQADQVNGPNNQGGFSHDYGVIANDPDLAALVTGQQFDLAILEFDFVPQGDELSLDFIWGSEEYPEYVDQSYNDVFGFFLSGPGLTGPYTNNAINIAQVPGGGGVVSIDNVNNVNGNNAAWYVDNTGGTTIQFDGFTAPIPVQVDVVACETYHIKMAVADLGDGIYDSGIFLKRHSFASNNLGVNTSYDNTLTNEAIEGCATGRFTVSVPNPVLNDSTITYTIGGTATNGVDYQLISNSVVIPAGEDHVEIVIVPFSDTLSEGQETVELTFSYVDACTGVDVVASVNINEAASFDPGDNVVGCGDTAIQAYVIGNADFEWYPTETGGDPFATSVNSNLSTSFPLTAMTEFTGTAPNRVFTVWVEDATRVDATLHPITGQYAFNNTDYRNGTSAESSLFFDVNTPFTLDGIDVRIRTWNATSTLVVNVRDNAGQVVGSATMNNVPNTNGNPQVITLVNMDIDIPIGTGYSLDIQGSTVELSWLQNGPTGWAPEDLVIGTASVGTITGNNVGWAPNATPYYFNWVVHAKANSDVCGRVEVVIPESCTCVAPNSVNVSASPSELCQGDELNIQATLDLGSSQNGGYRYTWFQNGVVLGTANNTSYADIQVTTSTLTDAGVYTLRVEDGDAGSPSCYKEDSVAITIHTIPEPPNTTPVEYCMEETASALSATGTSLQWYATSDANTPLATPPTPATSASGTQQFYVTQTSSEGCESEKAELEVTIHALPEPPTVTDLNLCQNTTAAALSATGQNLSWYTVAEGGTALSTPPIPLTTSTGITSYWASQTSDENCEGPRAELQVTIIEEPTVNFSADGEICSGEAFTIEIETTGEGPFNVQYHDGSQSVSLNQITDGHTFTVSPTSMAVYSLESIEMSNTPNCVGVIGPKDTLQIITNEPPTLSLQDHVCSYDQSYVATALLSGGSGVYSLISGPGTLSGNTITTSSLENNSNHTIVADDDKGCGPVSLDIQESCPCLTDAGSFNDNGHLNLCTDQLATFIHAGDEILDPNDVLEFLLVTDTTNPSGTIITRNPSPSFVYDPSTMSEGTTYFVIAAAGDESSAGQVNLTHGCTDYSNAVPVSFTPLPSATISGETPICEGQSAELVFDVTSFTEFQIGYSQNGISDYVNGTDTRTTDEVDPDSSTLYVLDSIHYTSSPRCRVITNGSVLIEVNDSILFNDSGFVCNNTEGTYAVNVKLIDGTGAYTLLSSSHGGNFIDGLFSSESILSGEDYEFVFADENQCNTITIAGNEICPCLTESGDLTSTTSTYLCEDESIAVSHVGNEVLDDNDVLQFILYSDENDPAGSVVDTSLTGDFLFESGRMEYEETYFIAAIAGNNDGSGFVDLESACLPVSAPLPVTFRKIPELTLSPMHGICEGESSSLEFTGNNISGYQFTYSDGTNEFTETASGNTHSISITPEQSTTYNLIDIAYVDNPTCQNDLSDSQTINVNAQPENAVISGENEACAGESVPLELTFDLASGTPLITWTLNSSGSIGTNSTTINATEAGEYIATINNDGCITQTAPHEVSFIYVNVSASADPAHIFYGSNSQIEAIGNSNWDYLWQDNTTNETFSGQQNEVQPETSTSYLVIAEDRGCTDTASVDIQVYPPVSAPYFFSPNNDGNNDIWIVDGLDSFPETHVYIYNRWGSKVAELEDRENQWDGRNRAGNPLPDGVYFYVVTATFPDLDKEDSIRFSGNVTISH